MKMETKTDESLALLICELKKKSIESKQRIWKRIALDLERPTRQRRVVNLSRLNRFTKDGETVIVPGKVLSSGELDHKITIAAWKFSDSAEEKIAKQNAKALTIQEFMKSDIKGKKIRIMG